MYKLTATRPGYPVLSDIGLRLSIEAAADRLRHLGYSVRIARVA